MCTYLTAFIIFHYSEPAILFIVGTGILPSDFLFNYKAIGGRNQCAGGGRSGPKRFFLFYFQTTIITTEISFAILKFHWFFTSIHTLFLRRSWILRTRVGILIMGRQGVKYRVLMPVQLKFVLEYSKWQPDGCCKVT